MKPTYCIRMRIVSGVTLSIVCLASAPAMAAEPAWWTQQKRDCNLPSNLAYNNWDGTCNSSRGSSSPVPAQPAAAAAAAAAAKKQQEEADRIAREKLAEKEKADFLRRRDEGASMLKGSSGTALNQLKGLANSGSSGLKGSGFDTSGTGLKELRGSDSVDKKAGSQHTSEVCRPSQDPAVVDLCFLGDRPAVIDPQILKGMSPAERTALKTSAKNMTEELLPFDKEMFQALADMTGADHAKTGKQWPGPDNPGIWYLNPLSEPEKVKAYWVKVNTGLHKHAEAQAKIITATPKGGDWRDLVARQDADPKFRKSKEQIIRNQENAESLVRHQTFMKFKEFLANQGGADWPDRIQNDKLFAARMVMEREALFKEMDQEIFNIRGKALQQMTILVKGWKTK